MKGSFFMLCLLGILSHAQRSVCQSNFQPGFIVTLEGDTNKGLIDFKQWNKNPATIRFKTVSGEKVQYFSPLQIKSFFVSDEYYMGGRFSMDKSPYRIEDLSEEDIAKVVMEEAFLCRLVEGELNLYYLKDKDAKVHFFMKKEGEDIQELVSPKHLTKDKGVTSVTTKQAYKLTLNYYMRGIPACVQKIETLPFKTQALTDVFEEYNRSVNNFISVYNRKDKLIYSPSVFLGLVKTTYNADMFTSTNKGTPTDIEFDSPDFYFTCGLGLNIMNPRKLQRLSLYNELVYKSIKYDLRYAVMQHENLYTLFHKDANLHILKYSIMPRFQPQFNHLRPFIEAGVSLGIQVGGDYSEIQEHHFYDQVNTSYPRNMNVVFGSLEAGIGCYYKGISAEFRSDITSISFQMGFTFLNKY